MAFKNKSLLNDEMQYVGRTLYFSLRDLDVNSSSKKETFL